jgi:hypothetical protein
VAYLLLALVAGAVTATMQGFGVGSWHWIGAAFGGPAVGLVVGLLKRIVSHADLRRWVLLGSLATLGLTVAGAQCAMCFFVGR